jgi:hypothetical protein
MKHDSLVLERRESGCACKLRELPNAADVPVRRKVCQMCSLQFCDISWGKYSSSEHLLFPRFHIIWLILLLSSLSFIATLPEMCFFRFQASPGTDQKPSNWNSAILLWRQLPKIRMLWVHMYRVLPRSNLFLPSPPPFVGPGELAD